MGFIVVLKFSTCGATPTIAYTGQTVPTTSTLYYATVKTSSWLRVGFLIPRPVFFPCTLLRFSEASVLKTFSKMSAFVFI